MIAAIEPPRTRRGEPLLQAQWLRLNGEHHEHV
jgi:hypothetical protein